MFIGRIVKYGFIYWLIGQVISYFLLQMQLSYTQNIIIFYVLGGLLPVFYFTIYFMRSEIKNDWKSGIKTAVLWFLLFEILSLSVYLFINRYPLKLFFTINSLFAFIEFVTVGAIVGEVIGRRKNKTTPEGLA